MKTTRDCTCVVSADTDQITIFLGQIFSFNASLKLFCWHEDGKHHRFNPDTLRGLRTAMDHLMEVGHALYGNLNIVVPETNIPRNILIRIDSMYCYVHKTRQGLPDSFQPPIDEYLEALQQLKYRLKRLKQVV